MNDSAQPETLDQFREAVLSYEQVLVVGRQTKPALSSTAAPTLSTERLSGIIQYEPSEFTFTALAGTTIAEIEATLSSRGQFLPFDPPLSKAGATIGGAVAAGLSGPGRMRFGGIRDFLLGVRFLSGQGDWIDSGGKVVKNAAGFDLPKFLVGSLGRYAAMAELTFKVFPAPPSLKTLCVRCASHTQALQRMSAVANSRWEPYAIDYQPSEHHVLIKLGGPSEAIESISQEIHSHWPGEADDVADAEAIWSRVLSLEFADQRLDTLLKVPTTGKTMVQLCESLQDQSGVCVHVSLAGQLTWISASDAARLRSIETLLLSLGLSGLVVRGEHDCLLGRQVSTEMQRAVKTAMDPGERFPRWPTNPSTD
ncbi:MAG: FAD-binding protein [Planctomycetota bacterium]